MTIPETYTVTVEKRLLWLTMTFLKAQDKTGPLWSADRALVKKAIDRRYTILEHENEDVVRHVFRQEHEAIVNQVLRGVRDPKPMVVYWRAAIQTIYYHTALDHGRWVKDHLKKFIVKAKKPTPTAEDDPLNITVEDFLRQYSSKRVSDITSTTREQIRKELAAGSAAGESAHDLAQRIDKLYLNDIIPNRSMVIARTETTNAAGMASHAAATGTGEEMTKSWLDVGDERVRETHADATDSEINVPLNQPFRVGDSLLMWPGDISYGASPEEVIQCRCSVIYSVL